MTDALETTQDPKVARISACCDRFEHDLDARLAEFERRMTLRIGTRMFTGMALATAFAKLV